MLLHREDDFNPCQISSHVEKRNIAGVSRQENRRLWPIQIFDQNFGNARSSVAYFDAKLIPCMKFSSRACTQLTKNVRKNPPLRTNQRKPHHEFVSGFEVVPVNTPFKRRCSVVAHGCSTGSARSSLPFKECIARGRIDRGQAETSAPFSAFTLCPAVTPYLFLRLERTTKGAKSAALAGGTRAFRRTPASSCVSSWIWPLAWRRAMRS